MASEMETIAALALACGLRWPRCRSTWCDGDVVHRCSGARGHANHSNSATLWPNNDDSLPPTLEAWQAEWDAEHPGETGPVREWTSKDGRSHWYVDDHGATIFVGALRAIWWSFERWTIEEGCDTKPEDVAELVRLMQAAGKAGS